LTEHGGGTWVGKPVERYENAALLRGEARFIDDLAPVAGMCHAAILRSPHGHAEILKIDASAAKALPGVVGVLTGAGISALSKPMSNLVTRGIDFYPCAVGKARYFGEPVAIAVASSRYIAEDALDLIEADYKPLPAVTTIASAIADGAPVLHERIASNIVQERHFRYGDPDAVFESAHKVVSYAVDYPRVNSTPMETYGLIAHFDPGAEGYTVWSNFQGPYALHPVMCEALQIRSDQLRLICAPSSGGSFGIKHGIFPYIVLMALASRKLGVPVKWTEDRIEHLAGSSASSGRLTKIEGAFDRDGVLLGLRLDQTENVGAYLRVPEPAGQYRCHAAINGPYKVRNVTVHNRVVVTNQVPSGLNRGYGGPQFFYPLERLMDVASDELGIDPAELRRRNLIRTTSFPYEGPAGAVYDSGDYGAALGMLLDKSGYEQLKADYEKRRAEGRRCGIGIAFAVETSGSNMGYVSLALTREQREKSLPKSGAGAAARVTMDAGGAVIVHIDSVPSGQGHRTVAAQIVADEMGVDPETVRVVTALDTLDGIWSITSGNYSNRFSTTVASSVALAARRAAGKLRRVAAEELGVQPAQVLLSGGQASSPGAQNRSVSLRRLASRLHWDSSNLPEGVDGPISEGVTFSPSTLGAPDRDDRLNSSIAYSFQCDLAAVEVDPDTGHVTIERYATVHDVGNMLNPMLVEGQILGGFAHGLGAALSERVTYGADGSLMTVTFQDYMCPTAPEIPHLSIGHISSPSPNTVHGSKGLGDGSSMVAPVALANAISHAIGVRDLAPPFTAPRIWALAHGLDPDADLREPPEEKKEASYPGRPLRGSGSLTLNVERDAVWRALLDVSSLKDVIPGCQEIEETGPNSYEALVDIRVAGIGGAYKARIELSNLREPEYLRLSGTADGALGAGKGHADVRLSVLPDGQTRLDYVYRAGITGRVVSFGHRMLDSVTNILISSFFESFETRLTGKHGAPPVLAYLRRFMLLLRSLIR
jgi:2-furoyl-CoA dehydrogenase large subunit